MVQTASRYRINLSFDFAGVADTASNKRIRCAITFMHVAENPYKSPTSRSRRVFHRIPNAGFRLHFIAALHVCIFAIFRLLRDHQFSLEDPYPYTNWSTSFLLASFALWLLGLIWCGSRALRKLSVPILVWVWLALSSLYVAWFFVRMIAFMAP